MTETMTRRGVKPLLALLLTGMTLLMTGAATPVWAAQASGLVITFIPGQPDVDKITWGANVTWSTSSTPHGIALWQINEVIQYYNATGPEGSPQVAGVTNGFASSPGDIGGNINHNGYVTASTNPPADATGYKWWYRLTVVVSDEQTSQQLASATTITPTQEQHGSFSTSGGEDPPPGLGD